MYFGISGLKAKTHCRWQDEPKERRRSILWEIDCSDIRCFEPEILPEKRLLTAMICMALADIICHRKDSEPYGRAMQWLNGMKSGISLKDCCEHLEVDPKCIRSVVEKINSIPLREQLESNINKKAPKLAITYNPVILNLLIRGNANEISGKR